MGEEGEDSEAVTIGPDELSVAVAMMVSTGEEGS